MKTPLRFQMTEYDCGTTSLQNVLSYLFEREETPADILKTISLYTLDCYDEKGTSGQGGTSRESINLIIHWIQDYASKYNFKINTEHLTKEEITLDKIINCTKNNGCILIRTYMDVEHYVILTNIDENNAYIWDPYYLDETYYDEEKFVEIIFDKPFNYNRKVNLRRFLAKTTSDFALGPIDKRDCVLFTREK